MNSYKTLSLVLALCVMTFTIAAQQQWSLKDCIQYAQKHHITSKQANNEVLQAEINRQLAKRAKLPSVDFNSNASFLFGRNIDPTTNAFYNSSIFYNNFRINASMPLYDGGRMKKTVQQNEYLQASSKYKQAQNQRDISLEVLNQYVAVLLAQEQLLNAQQNLTYAKEQLAESQVLIAAGARAANTALDIQAQIAIYEQRLAETEHLLVKRYLVLKNAMNFTEDKYFVIKKPKHLAHIAPTSTDANALYEKSLQQYPMLKAAAYQTKAAALALEIDATNQLPRLDLFASLTSNYSSAAERVKSLETAMISQNVLIEGQSVSLEVAQNIPTLENNPYFNQVKENFAQNVGIQFSVPIFDKGVRKLRAEKNKIDLANSYLAQDQLEAQLQVVIQQLLADIAAQEKKYQIIQNRIATAQLAFEKASQEFEIGVITSFDLFTLRNQLEIAEMEAIVAKYEWIFYIKTLDFYTKGTF